MGLIWTSEDSEFEPRRGYPWDALRATLSGSLGPDYEFLLAEPVPRRGEGRTDWYTDAAGAAAPVSALTPDQRTALLATLEHMQRQVLALADSLEAPNRRAPDKGLAQELRRAMVVPDPARHVWSVGGRPALVAWGLMLFGQKEINAPLIGEGLAKPAEPIAAAVETPPLPPKAPRKIPWAPLLWMLFAVLVAASYALLLRACGVVVAPEDSWLRSVLPAACHAQATANPLGPLIERRDELEALIRQAETDVARVEGDCEPPAALPSPPPPPPPPAPPKPRCPPPPIDLQRRLDRERAAHGKMEISLKWNGREDLDLHVKCPDGFELTMGKSGCGGKHDVDMNFGLHHSSTPVEHVVWDREPPHGRYQIEVVFFNRPDQSTRPVPFEVYVARNGHTERFRGVATQPDTGRRISVHRFTVDDEPALPPPSTPSAPGSAECTP